MRNWVLLLVVHLVLLALASTAFTAVTVFSTGHYEWETYTYHWQSGWGRPYEFPYSLATVLTYIAAYASGLVVYVMAWRWGLRIIGGLGFAVCALGFASFCYELTHWFFDFYSAQVISAPVALIPLALAALVQRWRLGQRGRGAATGSSVVNPRPLAGG